MCIRDRTRHLREYQEEPSKEEDLLKIPMLGREDMKKEAIDVYKRQPMTIPKEGLSGPFMIAKIYEMAKDAIMVTEVGQHQMLSLIHI